MDDESALPPSGAAVTGEHIEVRKEDTRLELTKSLREGLGDGSSAGGCS